MAPSEQIEVELKFDVDAGHTAPDLRILPGVIGASAPETFQLDATYFDTENLDLAGNRITMRRRTGGHDAGWHLKRPTGIAGARRELRIGFSDAPADADVPAELITPVIALTRTRKLRRDFVEEKYKLLINAMYDGSEAVTVEAPVTYRDGRTGIVATEIKVRTVYRD